MAITEVPTALQQKTVDGQDNGAIITFDFGLHQFQKYMTRANQIYSGSQLLISKKKFDSLSEKQKQIVLTAAKNAAIAQVKMNREMVESYYKEMAASGVEVIDCTPQLFQRHGGGSGKSLDRSRDRQDVWEGNHRSDHG